MRAINFPSEIKISHEDWEGLCVHSRISVETFRLALNKFQFELMIDITKKLWCSIISYVPCYEEDYPAFYILNDSSLLLN